MDKKQIAKLEIIQEYLPRCTSTFDCYIYGNIPKDKFNNARNAYAGNVEYSDVIGLIDATVFGSAKKGYLFTFDGFYYDGCSKLQKYSDNLYYKSISSIYNLAAMNELLQKLYEADTAPSNADKNSNGGFWNGIMDLGQAFVDGFNRGANLAEEIGGCLDKITDALEELSEYFDDDEKTK